MLLMAYAEPAAADKPTGDGGCLEQVVGDARLPANLPVTSTLGPAIPGLENDAVPQGLAYLPDRDWFLISLYRKNTGATPGAAPGAAFVVAVDCKTERLARCRILKDEHGQPHAGHVGGIAVDRAWLWIGSGSDVYRMPINAITGGEHNGDAEITKVFRPISTASFVACHDQVLWIGNFYKKKNKPDQGEPDFTLQNGKTVRGVLAGYSLDRNGDLPEAAVRGDRALPTYVFSTPEKVQGVAFHRDRILLSQSFGRHQDSTLLTVLNPLHDDVERPDDHATFSTGEQRALWFLSGPRNSGTTNTVTLPPMAEGIAVRDDSVAILFESGARTYRPTVSAWLDRLVYLPLAEEAEADDAAVLCPRPSPTP